MDRKTIGRYEILDELGRGAMGSVFRAKDPAVGRTVALKCIHSAALAGDQQNEFRDRFFREARAAGAMSHAGIVPVFDVGEDDGIPFLVMELVQGRTLADAMKMGERYSLERVCEIGAQIGEALGYAHRNGVVHRDIKPANVLMTSREVYGAERPRITDFGVAKLAGGELTTTGQLLGTPAFMAPEQFTGAPIDGRCDLFSLGVMLYRMATGEQPYSGETLTAVSYKIVHTDVIPPSRLNPSVGPRLEAALLKCLARNPDERFQTGEELAAELMAAAKPEARTTTSFAQPPAYAASYDPSQTIDALSGTLPRSYTGQAPQPQWSVSGAGQATLPAAQASPTQSWQNPAAPPQQWAAPSTANPLRAVTQAVSPLPRPMEVPPASQWAAPRATTSAASPAAAAPRMPEPTAASIRTSSSAGGGVTATMQSNPSGSRIPSVVVTPASRTIRVSAEEDSEPKKKRGVPILLWIVIAILAILAVRYLLQLRVDPTTQQVTWLTSQEPVSKAPSAS